MAKVFEMHLEGVKLTAVLPISSSSSIGTAAPLTGQWAGRWVRVKAMQFSDCTTQAPSCFIAYLSSACLPNKLSASLFIDIDLLVYQKIPMFRISLTLRLPVYGTSILEICLLGNFSHLSKTVPSHF